MSWGHSSSPEERLGCRETGGSCRQPSWKETLSLREPSEDCGPRGHPNCGLARNLSQNHWLTCSSSSVTKLCKDFRGGPVVDRPPARAGNTGSVPGLGRPTCRGATEPMYHSDWAWAREPVLCNKISHRKRRPHTTTREQPRSLQLERAHVKQGRPSVAKVR